MSGDQYPPCVPCLEDRHADCTEGVCGCLADHDNDAPIMRGFKRVKRSMAGTTWQEAGTRPYTSTVHIGVWRYPDGHQEYMSAITVPRQGEIPQMVGFDNVRSSWPYR